MPTMVAQLLPCRGGRHHPRVLMGLLLIAVQGPALAASVRSNLAVSANVTAACSVATPGLSFGQLAPGDLRSAQSTLTIVCPAGVAYQVTMDAGQHYDAALGLRRMFNANGDAIAYYLNKQDGPNAFPMPWGDAGFGNTVPGAQPYPGTGTGDPQTALIYGDIDYRNNPRREFPAGRYVDQIVMTIHY
ncbi:SCPU domain-containing protein [Stagnimonas aquatica]|uniref:SCPU domain-containing protein n=2 Tax=Stagnimonas aquatica TaxID=2689987 RepID=A0A3N0VLP4_9GAMM|nr:SCPU domain-containing protein [Stagnimonas aquatica]